MATIQSPTVSTLADRPAIDLDTLYHVLSYLTPDPREGINGSAVGSQRDRKALARLATVHSSFTWPVLAVMWRSLPSQQPLEHLLCVVGISSVEMCGTPSTHAPGWKRFQEYAALVREIIVYPFVRRGCLGGPSSQAELLEDTFWCQVSAAFGGGSPILPHLKRATVRSMDLANLPIDMGVLRLLNSSGQGIHKLEVSLHRGWPGMCEEGCKRLKRALRLVGSFSSIETLSVLVPHLDPVYVQSLPASHPHLRNLELHPPSHGAAIALDHLRNLAALTRLESLTFSFSLREPPKHEITFKELRSLKVSCYGLDSLGLIFAHINAPMLRSFSISQSHRVDSTTLSEELPCHLQTLLAKWPSLTAFEWDTSQFWMHRIRLLGAPDVAAPLSELVAPLLSHRVLQSFTVRFRPRGIFVSYTPADFRAFAQAWPDLETFCFYHDGDVVCNGMEQRADVESVVAFARHCPRLRNLNIPRVVQYDSDPSVDSVHIPAERHWLKELDVKCSACARTGEDDSEASSRRGEFVAQFRGLMKRIFPVAVFAISSYVTAN